MGQRVPDVSPRPDAAGPAPWRVPRGSWTGRLTGGHVTGEPSPVRGPVPGHVRGTGPEQADAVTAVA